jgi:hypothetical protein
MSKSEAQSAELFTCQQHTIRDAQSLKNKMLTIPYNTETRHAKHRKHYSYHHRSVILTVDNKQQWSYPVLSNEMSLKYLVTNAFRTCGRQHTTSDTCNRHTKVSLMETLQQQWQKHLFC